MDTSLTRRGLLGVSASALGWTALEAASGAQERGGGGGRGRPDFDGYLDGANNYDGEVVDMRGQAEATVRVGAGDSTLAFDPVAVHVDNGATVQWEWTGEGGAHSVVAEDGTFESGSPVQTTGVAFEHTFEEDGIYTYHCLPHEGSGMLGAVVVGTDYPRRATTPEPTPTPQPTPEGEWPVRAPETDWAQAGFDAANTRNPPVTGPRDGVRASGVTPVVEPILGAVTGDGTLFLGCPDRVVALDATSGRRQWELDAEWPLAFGDGRLYAVQNPEWERERSETDTLRSRVVCYDAATGDRQWRVRVPNGPVNDLALADGRLAVGATGGNGVLDSGSGERLWWQRTADTVEGLAVRDGTLYVSASAHNGVDWQEPVLRLRAYDADSGNREWNFETESYPPTPPAVGGGTVIAGSGSHEVHARDAATGDRRWTADLGSAATGVALTSGDGDTGTVYVGCHDYYLYAFDAETGDRQWRTRTRGTVSPPAVGDGVVYAANLGAVGGVDDDDGDEVLTRAVHGFDAASGDPQWTVELGQWQDPGQTPADVHTAPLLTDGTVYVPENRTRDPHRLQAVTGERARTRTESGDAKTAATTSDADGAGFTAIGTALAMFGVAGWQRFRADD
ncbi:halocyanin domain-containing protein [Halorientalis salina]|uniref:halocyanin domain-containing protein n=1 Tax=Halorientalis salina TaxID=2932266 RepID=UPI0010ADA4B5|nr:halocyanin domain-containing protein [Halorientalis salina]